MRDYWIVTYLPFSTLLTLNFDESKVPSLPNTTADLPCAFSCCAKSWACDATWNGRKTTFVDDVTLATSDEKSVAFWLTDSRSILTPLPESDCPTMSARPVEYDSWSSTIITVSPELTPS